MQISSYTKNGLALLFILLAFWPISSMQYTMKFDMMDWFYPMRYLIGECLQEGVLPLWNPYTNLGYPLHIDPQSGALYPVVWVLGWCFGYSVQIINVEFIIHVFAAYLGMKKLGQVAGVSENTSIAIALCFACGGFFVGNAQHLSWIIGAAWMPHILAHYWRLLRMPNWRDTFWCAVFCYLILTGGYPAFAIILFYLMSFAFVAKTIRLIRKKSFVVLKKILLQLSVFGIIVTLLSWVFLKFFIEDLHLMQRLESLTLEQVQVLPFSPQSFLSFLVPLSTGGDASFFQTDASMSNGYIGLLTLLMLVVFMFKKPDKKVIVIGGLSIGFLMIALGDFFLLRAWLYEYIPGMNLFRYPSFFRVFAMMGMLLLAGLGMDFIIKKRKNISWAKKLNIGISILLSLLLFVFVSAYLKSDFKFPETFEANQIIEFFNQGTTAQMILIQAPIQMFLLLILLGVKYFRKSWKLSNVLFVLLLIDMVVATQFNIFLTVSSEAKVAPLQAKIDVLPNGFPIPDKDVAATIHQGDRHLYPIWFNQNILYKNIAKNGYNNFKLKAYRDFKKSKSQEKILKHPILFGTNKDSLSIDLNITDFSPNTVIANLNTSSKSEVVFLQYYHPSWQIYLNEKPVKGFLKNNFFIGVEVPPGNHKLRITYNRDGFRFWLWISFGSFTILLVGLSFSKRIESV